MRAAALVQYGEVATELGLDPRAMLRKVELDARILTNRDFRFPADKTFRLLEISAQASNCETFGLRMAEGRRVSDYGPISLLLVHQPTLRTALRVLVRFQRMLNEALVIRVEDQPEDMTLVREELISGSGASLRQAYELAIGTMVHVFKAWRGPDLQPVCAHFTHGPPADLAVHRRILGPNIEFNAEFYGLTYRRADIDAPNPMADPAMADFAETFVRTLPNAQDTMLADEVQRWILQLLPTGQATILGVADRLGISERTLQRRLRSEDADFRNLLNEVRRDHAARYLTNQRASLWEIAGLLGYSRETSFARWFAGEFGMMPSAWRSRVVRSPGATA